MRKPLLYVTLLVAVIYACNQEKRTPNRLINAGKLATQVFTIDITKDTSLKTKKGAIIKIPKGSLTADGITTVQLQVKEAYAFRDMLRAGLITEAGGQPLSSGGMIYIDAVGENNVRITQAVSISIPTPYVDTSMKIWKGEVQPDSTIDWTKPTPLPDTSYPNRLKAGEKIFTGMCARCHSIQKDLTGPALANIKKRKWGGNEKHPRYWLFTEDPMKVLAGGDPYFLCLYEKWGKTPMPAFPGLTDADLTALYDYIQNESDRLALPMPKNDMLDCEEKCNEYEKKRNSLITKRDSLATDNRPREISDSSSIPLSANDYLSARDQSSEPSPPVRQFVGGTSSEQLYYQFDIKDFGWYNIDILLKDMPGLSETDLRVSIKGEYKERLQLYLAVPSIRLLANGGPLEDKKDEYGFFTKDGKIPLPLGAKAYILAMRETSETIQFAIKVFTIGETQQFELSLQNTTIEEFNKAIRSLGLDDISITAAETKNADGIRQTDTAIANLPLPTGCECMCEIIEK